MSTSDDSNGPHGCGAAVEQGRSEALGRVLYGSDLVVARDLLRVVNGVIRRATSWFTDRGRAIPSVRYLEAVSAQHAAQSFVVERRRRPLVG